MKDHRVSAVTVRAATGLRRALVGLAAASAVALAAGPALADYSLGLEAYKKGQYDVALDLWTRYAVAGDVRSKKALGDFYSGAPILNGAGAEIPEEKKLPPNYVEALKWYTLAAYHDFQTDLRMPTSHDVNAQIEAENRLPIIRGQMNNADVSRAETLVSETFERGSPRDIYLLGTMYRRGAGVEKDNVRALELFTVAAEKGVREAAQEADQLTDAANKLMNKKEIETALSKAASWQPPLPSEHTGQTRQMAELERLKKELEELRKQDALDKIADIDVEVIQRALRALGFYTGPIDNVMGSGTREAIRRFQYSRIENEGDLTPEQKRAAETGVLSAEDTVDLFRRAAGRGHAMSQYVYGIMFAREIGVTKDGAQAVNWLSKAADQNLALAHYALGVLYRDGTTGLNPVAPNKADAAFHFARARALGYGPAGRALELLEFERPESVE